MKYLAILFALVMTSACASTYETYYEPVLVYRIKSIEYEVERKPTYKRITRYVYKAAPAKPKKRVTIIKQIKKRRGQIDRRLKVIQKNYKNLPPCESVRTY